MGMVVRSNIMAGNANRQLGMNNSSVSKNLEKLSSGFKINRAGDDASGLAISEKMKAQIKGLETASSNSQDGISLVQTAEGALTEVHSMLNRMTELATKSANGTIKDEVDRDAIQKEVDALNSEIDRISQSTNFNGINLLDGSLGGAGAISATNIVAGGKAGGVGSTTTPASKTSGVSGGLTAQGATGAAGKITFKYKDKAGTEKTVTTGNVGAANTTVGAFGTAAAAELNKDADFSALFTAKADATTGVITIEAKTAGKGTTITELSTTATTDGAVAVFTKKTTGFTAGADKSTTYNLAANDTDLKAGDKISFGGKEYKFATGADGSDGKTFENFAALQAAALLNGVTVGGTIAAATFTKDAGSGLELQVGDTADAFNQVSVAVDDMSSNGLGTNGLNVATQDAAKASQKTIKDAINKVSTNRASLGALQNRLEYTINNLDVSAENMSAANSRIRDTDMAKQMMEYTKMNVLTQAAQAMLAQANQQPQSILQLLQ